MKLVGFTGAKYAGKDTAAKALMMDLQWQRMAFADPLREMLYTLNPVVRWLNSEDPGGSGPVRWRESWDTAGYDTMKTWPEVRRLMQVFGTEVMREQFGADVWVNLTMRKINPGPGTNVSTAITDVRFDNEAQAIRNRGGQVIEIIWTGPQDRDTHGAEHVSENGISRGLIDATIYNDGTEKFHSAVRAQVRALFH